MIVVDVLMEFLDWLTDRKNYQKRTLASLKITALIIFSVVILLGFLFILAAVFVMTKS